MDRRPLFVVAGVVVLGTIVWFARQPPVPGRGDAHLAIAPASQSAAPAATTAARRPGAAAAIATMPIPDPASRETHRLHMEDRFTADPLVPEWAQRNEKVVADFLAAPNLASLNLSVPLQQSVECRSTMCRIALLFPDIDAATPVHERMVLSVGAALPMARTFTVTHGDGRTELIVFAGDERAMLR